MSATEEIKVLVVDDSALMRRYLRQILESTRGFEVHTARNGRDALHQIEAIQPHVVTLDINMPVMDGLTCLSRIMVECPRPVVMLSSLTEEGAIATLEAMALGAVDYLAKPGGTVSTNLREVEGELLEKVRTAAGSRFRQSRGLAHRLRCEQTRAAGRRHPEPRRPRAGRAAPGSTGVVAVGVSTGGPQALQELLPHLPSTFPLPVLVAQHMPASFTGVFAERLDRDCDLTVREVSRPTPLVPGEVLIARGDADVVVGERGGRLMAMSVPASDEYLWHPSVERMVRSLLEHCDAADLTGVQLTGMGYDGAEAMAELYRRGGRTIAESEETAVVFGMPRELIERHGAEVVLPIDRIAKELCLWTGRLRLHAHA